ncbi:MAG: NAD-dependent epimerase/dehydratase family protein [Bdellovibrionaceae bacterium]|nr:NAD-dependent epimerase/dehydratase family protein [Pseudobdellovibrionaceae bacterium]
MKILVTGATGFVGSWMAKKLLTEGHEVHVLRRTESDLSQIKNLDLKHHIGDVSDLNSLISASQSVEAIFHLAGVVGYNPAMRQIMENVNVGGTENVVKVCQSVNIRRLVYMSSVVAIGASFDGRKLLNEASIYNLEELDLGYFQTKYKAEKVVKHACDQGLIDAVILNPSTIYGPGDAKKCSRKTQIKVAQGKMPFYTSGGVNVININDLINASYTAFKIGKTGERYILGGENITIKTLFELIAEAAGVPAPKIYLPNPVIQAIGFLGDGLAKIGKKGPLNSESAWTARLFHWFDSSKAQNELGLKITPAKESIKRSVNWMRENNII